jgi:hypothetical protein
MTAVINKLDETTRRTPMTLSPVFDTVTKPVAVSATLQKES